MNVLLTGGTGFFGSRLLTRLQAGCALTAMARCDPGPGSDEVRWLVQDLSADFHRERMPKDIDAIVHLAQSPQYRDFPVGAGDVFDVNVAGTARLLDYAAGAGARWFFLASTGSVYEPYCGSLVENAFVQPSSYYAASKLAAEALAQAYGSRFDVCIFRLFFPYGPGQTGKLMSNLVHRIRHRQPVTLDGTKGGLVFTPTYVDDVNDLIEHALREGWTGVFNVANPAAATIMDVCLRIGSQLGIEPVFERSGRPQPPPIRPNLEKLMSRCPSVTFTGLDQGLEKLIATPAIG